MYSRFDAWVKLIWFPTSYYSYKCDPKLQVPGSNPKDRIIILCEKQINFLHNNHVIIYRSVEIYSPLFDSVKPDKVSSLEKIKG